jgi:hypothetical protein
MSTANRSAKPFVGQDSALPPITKKVSMPAGVKPAKPSPSTK